MNKIIVCIIAIIVFVIIAIVGIANSGKSGVVGKWELEDSSYENMLRKYSEASFNSVRENMMQSFDWSVYPEVPSEEWKEQKIKEQYEEMIKEQIEKAKKSKITYEYAKDGNVKINISGNQEEKKYSIQGNKIEFISDDGVKTEYTIALKSKRLVLESDGIQLIFNRM